MNEIFQYFACDYAGCSHPATGQIFKSKTWLFGIIITIDTS